MGRAAKPWYRATANAWYATINGKQVRLATGAGRREEAMQEFYRVKAAAQEAAKQRQILPLGGLADMYLSYVRRSHESHAGDLTIKIVKSFVAHADKATASREIKPLDVSAWLESKPGWNHNTRANAIRVVKRMFNWAVEEGHLEGSPIAKARAPKSTPREAVLTGAQADHALATTKTRTLRDLMLALRETGCRPKEIATLTIDRINFEAGTWEVIDKVRKKTGRTHRTVYLSATALELSRQAAERHGEGLAFRNGYGEQWTRSTMGCAFRRLRKKMGYGVEFVPYAFRHLYITDALERGIPPATVAELVGHSSLKMIMSVYSKLRHRTEHLREAAIAIRKTPSGDHQAEAS